MALGRKVDVPWQYRIYCKSLQTKELNLLHHYLERSALTETQPCTEAEQDQRDPEQSRLIFQLDGEQWMDFPRELQWMTYLKEWHIPQNTIAELPPEIGKLTGLRELNVSYNRLSQVPPELGDCENLKRLELTGNHNLSELPFELSSLKQLLHLDIAENCFRSIPICALRMSALQLLDLSHNRLGDLPQDMDRLEQLVTLFLHKNNLTYLPHCLTKISTLKMIVVSGDELNSIPTRLCRNPEIKFIRLCDNRATKPSLNLPPKSPSPACCEGEEEEDEADSLSPCE
ncbi:hypothetical protein KUCAC02_027995 [Chaenocephalus aceratus]|uniref:Uncharacterized protein n=1 Tax=Chaenocephalus aceratus TaxID=36190 RepID=A0ACB9X1D9_CHAAC|nr:hypothetical protein KUCAC02_027995 [Chaenocephalus aceratus]